jgi:hypothetical protein
MLTEPSLFPPLGRRPKFRSLGTGLVRIFMAFGLRAVRLPHFRQLGGDLIFGLFQTETQPGP